MEVVRLNSKASLRSLYGRSRHNLLNAGQGQQSGILDRLSSPGQIGFDNARRAS